MTNIDVERQLTQVLHRHAEDAMNRTDTQHELQELLTRQGHEPPRSHRRAALVSAGAAAAAAAAVAGAVFWATDLTADRAEPTPAVEPVPPAVQVAEDFVAAYATNDTETVAAMAAEQADVRSWRLYMARDAAWGVEFMFEPCRQITTNDVGTGVACLFDLHALHSRELGRGPFEDATFTVWVDGDGKVFEADPTWNHENNGLMQHLDAVLNWVFETYPEDRKFLELDEPEIPTAQLDRWLTLWERYTQDYLEAHS